MDFSLIAYALPLVYAALQLEALARFRGHRAVLAHIPVAVLLAGFIAQFYLAALMPAIASHLPTIALGMAVCYLSGLFVAQRVCGPVYYDVEEDEFVPEEDNILWLDAYRGELRARA